MWVLWFFGIIKDWLIHVAPAMPPQCWPLTASVLLILAVAAVIDACMGIVPDILVFLGMFIVIAVEAFFGAWNNAAYHLGAAIVFALLIWVVNHIWYLITHRDALGMGDAKWTMVAVMCFGVVASVCAWGMWAILAVLFMGAMRLTKTRIELVTFAPFLFIGLCESLHWINAHGFNAWLNI